MTRLFAILIVLAVIAISAFASPRSSFRLGLPLPCFSTTDRQESPDPGCLGPLNLHTNARVNPRVSN